MKTVITFGVFDFYHLGHLRLFKQIRRMAGEPCKLIIAVQDDAHILSQKPDAKILYSTDERKEMLEAVRCVDEVIVYSTVGESTDIVEFDIFARAPEHTSDSIRRFEEWCVDNNKEIIITERTKGISSSSIKYNISRDLNGSHI